MSMSTRSKGRSCTAASASTPSASNGANVILEWIGSFTDIHDFKIASEMCDVLDTVPHIV
jgi:hypothetical protein